MTPDPAKPELVLTGPLKAEIVGRMEELYQVHKLWTAPDRAAFLQSVGPRARALVTTGSLGADAALIAALPRIGVIVCHGVGIDAIDLPAAAARKIPITTTPGVLTTDVADMAIALLFAVCRRVPEGDAFVRRGDWAGAGRMPLGRRVSGQRAGLIGLGQIGTAIARRLLAFEMKLSYVDPHPRPELAASCRAFARAADMAAECDFLIAAAAGGTGTRHIVDAEVLRALGPKGLFINVARGSLVDEDALISALQERRIGGAGLDVFQNEPAIDSRFLKLPNTVLLPHQASATDETRQAMGELVLQNLAAFFAGKPLVTPLPA